MSAHLLKARYGLTETEGRGKYLSCVGVVWYLTSITLDQEET